MASKTDQFDGRKYIILEIVRIIIYVSATILIMTSGVLFFQSKETLIIPLVPNSETSQISLIIPPIAFFLGGFVISISGFLLFAKGEMITLKIETAKDLYFSAQKLEEIASNINKLENHISERHLDDVVNNQEITNPS